MLRNVSKNLLQKSSLPVEQTIPDPWETSNMTVETESIPSDWQIPTETHPLVPPLGIPEARRLSSGFNTIKILLQDELKLKVTSDKLKTQIEQALGLLCWMEILTGANI